MLLQEYLDAEQLHQVFEHARFSSEAKSVYSYLYKAEEQLMSGDDHIGFYKRGDELMQVGPASLDGIIAEAKASGVKLDIIYAFNLGELFIPPCGRYEETWH